MGHFRNLPGAERPADPYLASARMYSRMISATVGSSSTNKIFSMSDPRYLWDAFKRRAPGNSLPGPMGSARPGRLPRRGGVPAPPAFFRDGLSLPRGGNFRRKRPKQFGFDRSRRASAPKTQGWFFCNSPKVRKGPLQTRPFGLAVCCRRILAFSRRFCLASFSPEAGGRRGPYPR